MFTVAVAIAYITFNYYNHPDFFYS